jgi:hypothetical protein
MKPRPVERSPTGLPIETEYRITKARLDDNVVEYALLKNGQLLTSGLGSDDIAGRKRAVVQFGRWIVQGRPPIAEGDHNS